MPPRVGQPAGGGDRGIGQFAGRVDPQDLTGAIATETIDGLSGDPGLRLAGSRGKRTYRGGGLNIQTYAEVNGGVNSEAALEALPVTAGTRSRALGQSSRLVPVIDPNTLDG